MKQNKLFRGDYSVDISDIRVFFRLSILLIMVCFSRIVIGGNGRLTVTTDPTNASLYIDGQLIGQTPLLKHPLPVGQHSLFLRDQTRQTDYTKTIDIVEDGDLALNISLKEEYGKLTVTSKPDSSDVYLITPLGKTPLIDERIDQGTFTFEIRNADQRYLPLCRQNIYIDKNNPGLISDSLKRRKLLTTRNCLQLGLGIVSGGSFLWGFISERYDHHAQGGWGYSLGTFFLCSVGVVALF